MSATRKFKRPIDAVYGRGRLNKDIWPLGCRAVREVENDRQVRRLYATAIFWLDQFSADNSYMEFLRLFLLPLSEEVH
jgi:hypothetical protein